MLHRKPKETIAERKHPGDPEPEWCSPGSIEQELDMCETGSLRGDDILYSHGREPTPYTGDPVDLDQILDDNWQMDLSEEDREGAEMSGDEHSMGMEGGESELISQPYTPTGLPGDRARREEQESRLEEAILYPEETEIPQAPQTRPTSDRTKNSKNSRKSKLKSNLRRR